MIRFKRKDYDALEGWIRFVNSEDESAPGVPMAITRGSNMRESLRQDAGKLLRAIASRPQPSTLRFVPLPPRPSRLMIAGDTFHLQEGKDWLRDGLIVALTERALSRIRICCEDKCGKLFLAMDRRAKHCSPRCASRRRQRKFYKDNTEVERARKRSDYKKNQARNKEARRAREEMTFLDGKPIVKPVPSLKPSGMAALGEHFNT